MALGVVDEGDVEGEEGEEVELRRKIVHKAPATMMQTM